MPRTGWSSREVNLVHSQREAEEVSRYQRDDSISIARHQCGGSLTDLMKKPSIAFTIAPHGGIADVGREHAHLLMMRSVQRRHRARHDVAARVFGLSIGALLARGAPYDNAGGATALHLGMVEAEREAMNSRISSIFAGKRHRLICAGDAVGNKARNYPRRQCRRSGRIGRREAGDIIVIGASCRVA